MRMMTCVDCGTEFHVHSYINGKSFNRKGRVRCDTCNIEKKQKVSDLTEKRRKDLAGYKRSNAATTGLIGEYQFVVDSLKHNLFTAKPVDVSSQADFVVCNQTNKKFINVQVKALTKCNSHGTYKVTVVRNDRELNSYTEHVDIVAVLCIDINTWFIIPIDRLNNRYSLGLSASGQLSDCIGFDKILQYV
jgi:hypothetical protein